MLSFVQGVAGRRTAAIGSAIGSTTISACVTGHCSIGWTLTVTFTAIGAHIPGAVFSIVSRNGGLKLLPNEV
jgi:hypothetical protein